MKLFSLTVAALCLLSPSVFAELIRNGDFSARFRGWELERIQNARASFQIEGDPDGVPLFARVVTPEPAAAPFHVQLVQRRLMLEEGRSYRLTFKARSESAARIGVNIKIDRNPWPSIWTAPVELETEWKTFSYVFTAKQTTDIGRLTFSSLGARAGRYDFADVSIVVLEN